MTLTGRPAQSVVNFLKIMLIFKVRYRTQTKNFFIALTDSIVPTHNNITEGQLAGQHSFRIFSRWEIHPQSSLSPNTLWCFVQNTCLQPTLKPVATRLRFFSWGRKNLVSCPLPTTLLISRKVVQISSRFSMQNNSSSNFNIRYQVQLSSKSITFSKMAIKGVNMSYNNYYTLVA